jgi:hypothetical protein
LNCLFCAGIPFVGGPERVANMIEELAWTAAPIDSYSFSRLHRLTRFDDQAMPL